MESGNVEVHPATADRFPDLAQILAPKSPPTPACWCLSYRLSGRENSELTPSERPERLRQFCAESPPPGLLAYVDAAPAAWCSVAPRESYHRLVASRTIPKLDDAPVWSVTCFVVRSAYRRRGLARQLLGAAIEHARSHGVPALEGYPVDPAASRISPSLAYCGTTELFEAAGFRRAVRTTGVSGGAPRWVMRMDLNPSWRPGPAIHAG
jgi:GNAT superfamily N-acetyltransferase